MIKITKIDKQLRLLKDRDIIIWGTGAYSVKLYRILNYFGINRIIAFCDNDKAKWGGNHLHLPIISPEELLKIYDKEKILVNIGCRADYNVSKQLEDMGISEYLYCEETEKTLLYEKNKMIEWDEDIHLHPKYKIISGIWEYIKNNPDDNHLFLCMPQKAANVTVEYNLNRVGYDNCALGHTPTYFKYVKKLFKKEKNIKIRVITAVREPIEQNLSAAYQYIGDRFSESAYWNIEVAETDFEKNNDAQYVFDEKIKKYMACSLPIYDYGEVFTLIQNFIPMFCENIIDLFQFKFDKERGYSIFKKDNIEVFVYQLEKLNDISDKIFEWLGIEPVKLLKGNVGVNKWYAKSYKQAKEEIVISQEYFDKCFNEPYVKHFYSDEDIERFKNKWRKHIKNEN